MAPKLKTSKNIDDSSDRVPKPKKKLGIKFDPYIPMPHVDLIRPAAAPELTSDLRLDQKIETTSLDQLNIPQDSQDHKEICLSDLSSLLKNDIAGCQNSSLLNSTSLVENNSLPIPTPEKAVNLWATTEGIKGHLKLPNAYLDSLCRLLDPSEQVVYLQLYRLSWGYGKDNCNIGLPKLAERANVSRSTAQQAIRKLVDKKLIEKIDWTIGYGKDQGTLYRLPVSNSLVENNSLLNLSSLPESTPIKEMDHDDFKKKDHHQNAHARETMTLYQKLTGNTWTKADDKSYAKIAHLPLDQIATTLRAVMGRATQKPASLAYFVKEILNPTQPNPANREALKKKYKAIVSEIRELNVGGGWRLADIVPALKDRLVSDGIPLDLDLINECLN